MENTPKKETRGRKKMDPALRKNSPPKIPPKERIKVYNQKLIDSGGLLLNTNRITDPALASKIREHAETHHGGSLNETVRDALKFFFEHH